MLKRGNDKTYRLYKKDKKSFSKAPCEALDIKHRIGQNSQLHSFTASQLHSFTASQLRSPCAQINLNINYSNHAQRPAVSQRLTVCFWAFFIPETGEAVRATVIAENKPARLMAIIPADLAAGNWYIEVRAKYANATKQLKTLKAGRFGKALTRNS